MTIIVIPNFLIITIIMIIIWVTIMLIGETPKAKKHNWI